RVWDADGKEYIDYIGSWGPLIFGHRPPEVLQALSNVLEVGTSFGAPTECEVEIAELITKLVPSVEKVRLVNSGTEATMSAIRLARGFTGRDHIDYIGSWGPLIFGHRPPEVLQALSNVLEVGTSFGAPTECEVEIAELITKLVPSVEKVRLVNSGTEATMSAIRLARGFTGRD